MLARIVGGLIPTREEERITGLLRSLQHPLQGVVQTSCYRLVLL